MSDIAIRRMQGLFLLVLGAGMSKSAGPLAALLTSQGASQYLVAGAELLGALALVPIVLGLYRLVTQGKRAS
jgi:hypothetical protein